LTTSKDLAKECAQQVKASTNKEKEIELGIKSINALTYTETGMLINAESKIAILSDFLAEFGYN
jgi:hypothetical protein